MTVTPIEGVEGLDGPTEPAPVQLSVLIACLDGVETLGAQLDALAAQRPGVTWELLLCDNGSTDGSIELARSYADRLPLVVVDAGEVRGAGAARNVGARLARGEQLAFCDADDVVGEGWLDAMAAALTAHAFVAGRFESSLLNSRRALRSRSLDQQDGLQRSPTGLGLPHAGAGNMGIRRDLFLRVGGFDTSVRVLEDTDFSWRVQRSGVDLVYAPDAVVHVRLRSSLRQMYRQGRDYGQAHALLEHRYGAAATEPRAAEGQLTGVVSSTGRRGLAEVARAWMGERPSLSRVVWQFGWHRGYRAGRTDPALLNPQAAHV